MTLLRNAPADGIVVRQLEERDLSQVAVIHCRAFAGTPITLLGTEAVRRYYAWQLNGPHDCYAMGAWADNLLCGYYFGGVFRGAFSGFIRTQWPYLSRQVLLRPHLLAQPLVWARALQAVRSLVRSLHVKPARIPARCSAARSFGILAIAVDPTRQRLGVGQHLMAAAEAQARQEGFARMHLTVEPENEQAVSFYLKLGWRKKDASPWAGHMERFLTV